MIIYFELYISLQNIINKSNFRKRIHIISERFFQNLISEGDNCIHIQQKLLLFVPPPSPLTLPLFCHLITKLLFLSIHLCLPKTTLPVSSHILLSFCLTYYRTCCPHKDLSLLFGCFLLFSCLKSFAFFVHNENLMLCNNIRMCWYPLIHIE